MCVGAESNNWWMLYKCKLIQKVSPIIPIKRRWIRSLKVSKYVIIWNLKRAKFIILYVLCHTFKSAKVDHHLKFKLFHYALYLFIAATSLMLYKYSTHATCHTYKIWLFLNFRWWPTLALLKSRLLPSR